MGFYKDRMIQEEDQGWAFRDGDTVCFWCVRGGYLRRFVKSNADQFYLLVAIGARETNQ